MSENSLIRPDAAWPSRARGRFTLRCGALVRVTMLAAAIALCGGRAARAADAPPQCAWPIEVDGSGPSNLAYPDPNAAYWVTPFDPGAWSKLIVRGRFPSARLMELAAFDARGTQISGLIDLHIAPDKGSLNPFRPDSASAKPAAHNYTVTVGRKRDNSHNYLGVAKNGLAWLVYRVYTPNRAIDRKGGVPLPTLTLVAADGRAKPLAACRGQRYPEAIAQTARMLRAFGDPGAVAADYLANAASSGSAPSATAEDRLACAGAPPAFHARRLGGLFRYDAVKLLASGGICPARDRIVVVRGKAPGFPDTFPGAPVWKPAPRAGAIAMRYWSLCDNLEGPPAPVAACRADWETRLDASGFYTYVLAPGYARPTWLAADASFLPWNAAPQPNTLILRNLLPANSFVQSIQAVEHRGCVVGGAAGKRGGAREIAKAGACAEKIMGPYYPRAVYCDRNLYIKKGWQGCFAAAGVSPP